MASIDQELIDSSMIYITNSINNDDHELVLLVYYLISLREHHYHYIYPFFTIILYRDGL